MAMPILAFEDVSVHYNKKEKAIDNLSFSIQEGEFVGLMGANGAGKSTIAQSSVGIIPHHVHSELTGDVRVFGKNTADLSVSEITDMGIGIIFQEPDLQLVSINVELEVAFGLENRGMEKELIRKRVMEALKQVRLEKFLSRAPDQLSGGQKQSVCIAAVLALRPKLLVLDEPTSQLDPIGSQMVFDILRRVNQEHGISILLLEHKAELMAKYCDRIITIDKGKKVFEGTPNEVFCNVKELIDLGAPVPQVSQLIDRLGWSDRFSPANFPVTEDDVLQYLLKTKGEMQNVR